MIEALAASGTAWSPCIYADVAGYWRMGVVIGDDQSASTDSPPVWTTILTALPTAAGVTKQDSSKVASECAYAVRRLVGRSDRCLPGRLIFVQGYGGDSVPARAGPWDAAAPSATELQDDAFDVLAPKTYFRPYRATRSWHGVGRIHADGSAASSGFRHHLRYPLPSPGGEPTGVCARRVAAHARDVWLPTEQFDGQQWHSVDQSGSRSVGEGGLGTARTVAKEGRGSMRSFFANAVGRMQQEAVHEGFMSQRPAAASLAIGSMTVSPGESGIGATGQVATVDEINRRGLDRIAVQQQSWSLRQDVETDQPVL